MGCGSGANAILAAQRTDDVVAVDVNPHAVSAAAANAANNGVAERVRCAVSDLFEHVEGLFDVIVFDPPFRWFAPRDLLERAITDENYETLGRFIAEAPRRLREHGCILLFFGTSGDVGHLDALTRHAGFVVQTIAERTRDVRGESTTYFVRRLVNTVDLAGAADCSRALGIALVVAIAASSCDRWTSATISGRSLIAGAARR